VLAGNKAYTVSKEGYNNAGGNINVDGDETVDVTLTKKTYTLTVNTVGEGTVTKNPDKATYNHGEVVQLAANPAENWIFTGWSGDLTGSTNPANITMNSNKTVTANFTRIYTVTFNVSDNQGVVQGANVAFNGENKSTDAQGKAVFTGVLAGNKAYTVSIAVTFKIKTYTISVSANPSEGGTASGGGTFSHNQQVNLSATQNAGYQFLNWTEGGSVVSTKANYSFPATGNRTLVANFNMIKGTIEISDKTIDGFGQIEVYAENFGFNVGAIEYVLSYDPAKLSILAMANNPELNWTLQNLFKSTDGIIHFVGGGQPVDLSTRKKIATITVSEVSSGSTTIGFTKYIYNDVEVETAVTNDSQPPEEIRSPHITLVPGTITIN